MILILSRGHTTISEWYHARHRLLLLLYLLLFSSQIRAIPKIYLMASYTDEIGLQYYIDSGCTAGQRRHLQEAFEDAKILSKGLYS